MNRDAMHGFTLIEAILVMLIIAAGAVGLMTAIATTNRQVMDGNMTVIAAMLAQEQLDRVVADKVFKGYPFISAAHYPSPEPLSGAFAGFRRSTTITEVKPEDLATTQPGSGVKRIDIDVQWGAAATQRVRLTTLVTGYL